MTRTSIRFNAVLHGLDFVGAGVEVGHPFNRVFEIEGSLNAVDLGRGYGGAVIEGLLRFGYFGARQAVSAGVGPAWLSSVAFGNVVFLIPEIGYEYRARGGFSLMTGLGLPITLNDSLYVPCQQTAFLGCFLDRTQLNAGDVTVRLRLAVGYAF